MSALINLKSRMLSGSIWAVAGELVAGGARALSYVIYAKLLSPTDFGVVGFALLLVSVFPLVIDNSLGLALMRHSDTEDVVYSTTYVLNITLALLAVLGLAVMAPYAASFLHDKDVIYVLPILSIQLILNALSSVHIANARRRFEYKRLAPVRIISSICSLMLGLPLAFFGFGYWALVGASLGGALGQTVSANFILNWRPSFRFDWGAFKAIAGFASWVSVDMAITWMVISGGGFFLAFFLGAHDLGLVRLSDQIDAYCMGAILNPLIPVLYASFCEVTSTNGASWHLFERSVKRLTPISLGAAGALIVAAWPLGTLLGGRWHGISEVICLNAAADGISFSLLGFASLLRAHGLVKSITGLRIATVIAQIFVYWSVAHLGVLEFLTGKLCIELLVYAASFIMMRVIFSRKVFEIIGGQFFQAFLICLCTVVGVISAYGAQRFGAAAALGAGLFSFGICFGTFLVFTQRDGIRAILAQWSHAKT